MDDPLQKLVKELRGERCPASVMDHVAERIAADATVRWRWLRRPALVLVILVLVVGLMAWHWPPRSIPQAGAHDMTEAERALVIEQTRGALAYVGHTLIKVAVHTEGALQDQAIPPLRDGFRTAKNKLIESI